MLVRRQNSSRSAAVRSSMTSCSFPVSRSRMQATCSPVQMLLRMTGSYYSGGQTGAAGAGFSLLKSFTNTPPGPLLAFILHNRPRSVKSYPGNSRRAAKTAALLLT